ncbi:hypothetical protein ACFPRL_13865 [Pseudoclavibacter helvolus]
MPLSRAASPSRDGFRTSGWVPHFGMGCKPSRSEEAIPKLPGSLAKAVALMCA